MLYTDNINNNAHQNAFELHMLYLGNGLNQSKENKDGCLIRNTQCIVKLLMYIIIFHKPIEIDFQTFLRFLDTSPDVKIPLRHVQISIHLSGYPFCHPLQMSTHPERHVLMFTHPSNH